MFESATSALGRLIPALASFWRVLVDADFAAGVAELRNADLGGGGAAARRGHSVPRLKEAEPNAGLQLLGLLQQEGRFIDFLEDDVTAYSDAEVGAAARVVHEGCKKAVKEHFAIETIRPEPEGTRVTLQEGFDASAVRVTGKVVGQPPFTGNLTHQGWRVTQVRLPQVAAGHYLNILAPAEVEL